MGKIKNNSASSYLCVSKNCLIFSRCQRSKSCSVGFLEARPGLTMGVISCHGFQVLVIHPLLSCMDKKSPPTLSPHLTLLVFSWSMSPRPRLLSCHPPPLLHGQEAPSPHVSRQEHLNCHIWWSSVKCHRHQFIIVVTKNKDSNGSHFQLQSNNMHNCTCHHLSYEEVFFDKKDGF